MIQLKNTTDSQVFHILKNNPKLKSITKRFQSKNYLANKVGTFKILPDEGYYAMTSVNLDVDFTTDSKSETYTENGEYQVLPNEGSVGLSDVTINVDVQPPLQDKQVTYNEVGTYNVEADEGYYGLDNVEITFEYPLEEVTDTVTENGVYTYEPSEGYKGLSKVDVTVEAVKPFVVPAEVKFGESTITEFPTDWIWSEVEQSTDQSDRFYNCGKLLQLPKLVITNATDTSSMFYHCDKISEIDMSEWDLSKVINMSYMFYSCYQLESIKWGDFNTGLNKNFNYLFNSCDSLHTAPEIDCSSNTSTYSKYNSPFGGCELLRNFGGMKGINKSIWFEDTYSLSYESLLNILNGLADGVSGQTLTLHKDLVNQLSDDDIAIATNKGWSISPAKTITEPVVVTSLSQVPSSTYNITPKTYDFSQFTGKLGSTSNSALPCKNNIHSFEGDISNANVQFAFGSCSSLAYVFLKTNIAGASNHMFYMCKNLLELTGLEGYVTNANSMFQSCEKLETIDLSKLDLSQCTLMQYMFDKCSRLKTIIINSEINPNVKTTDMFRNIATEGTFYYNPAYDYSKIIEILPEKWIAKPME